MNRDRANEVLGTEDMKAELWRPLIAELLGSLLINLLGCASIISGAGTAAISLAFGLTIMAIVLCFSHVSGAHANPAITWGMIVAGNMSILKGLLYVVFQMVGATIGSLLLKLLVPKEYEGWLGATVLSRGMTAAKGFGVEFFLGLVVVFVVLAFTDKAREERRAFAPYAIGLTFTMGHTAMITYTGSSMNPARSFGSALVSGTWSTHWIYWVGPIVGGTAAAVIYKLITTEGGRSTT